MTPAWKVFICLYESVDKQCFHSTFCRKKRITVQVAYDINKFASFMPLAVYLLFLFMCLLCFFYSLFVLKLQTPTPHQNKSNPMNTSSNFNNFNQFLPMSTQNAQLYSHFQLLTTATGTTWTQFIYRFTTNEVHVTKWQDTKMHNFSIEFAVETLKLEILFNKTLFSLGIIKWHIWIIHPDNK